MNSSYYPHPRVQLDTGELSLVKQSMQAETDINTIMARYEKTGLMSHVATHKGQYGDFVTAGDYQDHLNQIIEAKEAFSTLPAKVRKKFDNDPSTFLEFVQDEENIDEMIEMGLLKALPASPDPVNDNPEPDPMDEEASPAPAS